MRLTKVLYALAIVCTFLAVVVAYEHWVGYVFSAIAFISIMSTILVDFKEFERLTKKEYKFFRIITEEKLQFLTSLLAYNIPDALEEYKSLNPEVSHINAIKCIRIKECFVEADSDDKLLISSGNDKRYFAAVYFNVKN